MNYKTIFIWSKNKDKLYIFYKYNLIGLIPTEIDFTYRNKHYSTIKIMDKLANIKNKWNKPKYISNDWYDLETSKFNKLKFVNLFNML